MDHPGKRTRAWQSLGDLRSGLGVPCTEAQADGVPCTELGIECTECDKGRPLDVPAARSPTSPDMPFEIAGA